MSKQAGQNLKHEHGGSTGKMSANATGDFGGTDGGFLVGTKQKGNVYNQYCRTFDGNGKYPHLYKCHIDVSHTHSFTTNSSGGDECRPNNFTIRIWKRTA